MFHGGCSGVREDAGEMFSNPGNKRQTNGLLGWWVFAVLIDPAKAWKRNGTTSFIGRGGGDD